LASTAGKELLAYLVVHNLVRCLIAQAVATCQVDLERVSFKGSVDALRQYSNAISQARNLKLRNQLWEDLLLSLAPDLVPYRPNRIEPRALKRRPKNFGWLTKPRPQFRESFHRNRYRKLKPRNYRDLNQGPFWVHPCPCHPSDSTNPGGIVRLLSNSVSFLSTTPCADNKHA